MEKIVIIGHCSRSIFTLRGDLIKTWIEKSYQVHVIAPDDIFKDEIENLGIFKFHVVEVDRTGTNIIKDISYIFRLK